MIKLIFDLIFTVDVTSHLNDLNLKLRRKDKLISRFVNDIRVFKMKLKPSISQLKSKDLIKFPQLKEQSQCADDLDNFTEYI